MSYYRFLFTCNLIFLQFKGLTKKFLSLIYKIQIIELLRQNVNNFIITKAFVQKQKSYITEKSNRKFLKTNNNFFCRNFKFYMTELKKIKTIKKLGSTE